MFIGYKKITKGELEVFLRKHKLWLIGGPEGERANLTDANLYGANLYGANLYGADLTGANLTGAEFTYPIACPEKGSFIGFKKVRENYIVELEIPEDAMRCSATSRKCRCNKAKVIAITNKDGSPSDVKTVYSKYDISFAYTVGETVSVDNFDHDRWYEFAPRNSFLHYSAGSRKLLYLRRN